MENKYTMLHSWQYDRAAQITGPFEQGMPPPPASLVQIH